MRVLMRVCAIIFYKEKIILTKMRKANENYYVLPGGGVEDNESLIDALKREIKEELNIEILDFRLAYIRELKIREKGRGIEFYFYVKNFKCEPKKGFDPEKKESSFEEVCFLNVDELENINFHPKKLVDILKRDKEENFNEVKHIGLCDYP